MATDQLSQVVQKLRNLALLPDGAGLSDRQLLESFITGRDEAAFAALVRRHGQMVWGVCRRVLRSHHDAEDAFQATFLVLVRKAAAIASRELLANWLYGVAHRTALKARAAAARRGRREKQVEEMPDPPRVRPDPWQDLEPLLDEELSRLPDKYRQVLLLCDLEGKTRRQAASQLGLAEGTVAGQLARARAMLAQRLLGRGVSVSSGLLASVLAQNATAAPMALVSATVQAASLVGASGAAAGFVSPKVAALIKGALRTMFWTKTKLACVMAIVAAGISATVGWQMAGTTSAAGRPMNVAQAKAKEPKKPAEPKLEKEVPPPPQEKRFKVEFRATPWPKVLEWYSEISGLPYVGNAQMKGGLTIIPGQGQRQLFTVNEITDLLNEELLQDKYILFRGVAAFTLIPADQTIDPAFVPRVAIDQLDRCAKSDLVTILVQLNGLKAKQFAPGAKKMLSPMGQVVVLEKTNQLILFDSVFNLTDVVRMIQKLEGEPLKKK